MTADVNFTNILQAVFTFVDPKSVKTIYNLTVFFTLLGSTCVKAVRRTVNEIELRCQFHQHFMSNFLAKILSPKKYNHKLYLNKSYSYKKAPILTSANSSLFTEL